jgi:hypothetical protein
MLGQPGTRVFPAAFETRQAVVIGVGDGEERQAAPPWRHHLDLEPLPNGRGDGHAASQVKNVVGDYLTGGVTGRCARFEQPVRDDHARRQPADADRHSGSG